MQYKAIEISSPLCKVKPTASLMIHPMPCEKKAAYIRNEAIDAIQQDNPMEVGYRFLQSRKGQNSTCNEALIAGMFLLLVVHELYNAPGSLRACDMLFYAANMIPNILNTSRYQETKNICATWLKKEFGEQEFNQIQKMSYSNEGLASFTFFLKSKNIPTNKRELGAIPNASMWLTVAYFIPGAATILLVHAILQNVMEQFDIKTSDLMP